MFLVLLCSVLDDKILGSPLENGTRPGKPYFIDDTQTHTYPPLAVKFNHICKMPKVPGLTSLAF